MGNMFTVFWPETHCFGPKIWEHILLSLKHFQSEKYACVVYLFLSKCFGDKSTCSQIFGPKQCVSGLKTANTFPIHLSPETFWVIQTYNF